MWIRNKIIVNENENENENDNKNDNENENDQSSYFLIYLQNFCRSF